MAEAIQGWQSVLIMSYLIWSYSAHSSQCSLVPSWLEEYFVIIFTKENSISYFISVRSARQSEVRSRNFSCDSFLSFENFLSATSQWHAEQGPNKPQYTGQSEAAVNSPLWAFFAFHQLNNTTAEQSEDPKTDDKTKEVDTIDVDEIGEPEQATKLRHLVRGVIIVNWEISRGRPDKFNQALLSPPDQLTGTASRG